MKNLKTLALSFIAVAGFSAAAFATAPDECKGKPGECASLFTHHSYISVSKPDRLNVVILKQDQRPVSVRIYNADGDELMRTQVSADSALLPVNIADLPAGTYTLKMMRDAQVETDSFTVN